MKMILFIYLLLSIFNVNGQSVKYHSFPDDNAIWNFHFYQYCWSSGVGDEYYSITISGDTLIDNQTYNKLFTPYVLSFSTGTCGGLPSGYKGAIRQDTNFKQVYFIPPADTIEQLLYDFNMQVGDTVNGYLGSLGISTLIVQSIDSVKIGNSFRKRWLIDPFYNVNLIEGIGSTYGLIEPSHGGVTDFPDYTITCFQQDGLTLYPDSATNCQVITSIPSTPYSNHINVFPNPSSGSFTIEFILTNTGELFISDMAGRVIHKELINNKNSIEIDGLQSGTYFLKFIGKENRAIYNKIIISP